MRAVGVAADGCGGGGVSEGFGCGADRGDSVLGDTKDTAMGSRLDEFKDGEPMTEEQFTRLEEAAARHGVDVNQVFLAEYLRLISEVVGCGWPHAERVMTTHYSSRTDSYSHCEATWSEHRNFIVVKGDVDQARMAKLMAYDAFENLQVLRRNGKLTAVRGMPKFIVMRRVDGKISCAWYAQIYS